MIVRIILFKISWLFFFVFCLSALFFKEPFIKLSLFYTKLSNQMSSCFLNMNFTWSRQQLRSYKISFSGEINIKPKDSKLIVVTLYFHLFKKKRWSYLKDSFSTRELFTSAKGHFEQMLFYDLTWLELDFPCFDFFFICFWYFYAFILFSLNCRS